MQGFDYGNEYMLYQCCYVLHDQAPVMMQALTDHWSFCL